MPSKGLLDKIRTVTTWEYALLVRTRLRLYPNAEGVMMSQPTQPGQAERGEAVIAWIVDWFGPDGSLEEWTTPADWTEGRHTQLMIHLNRAGAQGWELVSTSEDLLTSPKPDEVPSNLRILPPDVSTPIEVRYLFRRAQS